MKLHRNKTTGPGEITTAQVDIGNGDLRWVLTYVVGYDELDKNGAVLQAGDTVLIWVDTQYKGIQDRAPDTVSPCSKPQSLGEVVEITLS
jgi:hypothetical protein